MNKIKTVLKNEFVSGKTWFDWAFLTVGLTLQIIAIVAGFVSGEPESIGLIISGLAGVVSVVLCSQGKISFYVFAFVQLFTYVPSPTTCMERRLKTECTSSPCSTVCMLGQSGTARIHRPNHWRSMRRSSAWSEIL